MIARAQAGSKSIRNKIVLHHIGFIMWRLRKKIFPEYLKRHGDDILSAAILELYRKVETYNLNYRDRKGVLKPVRFSSYMWKRIDGLAIDYIKREKRGIKRQQPLVRESRNRLLCGQEACVL
ncbi:MAG: hypothetical protein A2X34_05275 [Elusimicrobia bacterium GWC2_51_8]|nr:MAG: hypothetical protein A2X33_10005 [Elusimicrobia bacterium GWA2_51_34]OGR58028.1 MAG: hypothetical protein A2X34_05275 [Elusimicrobia bacterium GWC2_51_8]OGR84696.1 MAG: hypothetical protein A2021_03720 [Elusimicrobia bacterium GWF2_52_66]